MKKILVTRKLLRSCEDKDAKLFDEKFNVIDVFQKKFKQIYSNESWVEHNPEQILETVICCCEKVLKGNHSK